MLVGNNDSCGEPVTGRPLRNVVISQCGELVNPAEYSMPFLNLDTTAAGKGGGSGNGGGKAQQLSLVGSSSRFDSTDRPKSNTAFEIFVASVRLLTYICMCSCRCH